MQLRLSDLEIEMLRKLVNGEAVSISSQQRVRLELAGMIREGAAGIMVTFAGRSLARQRPANAMLARPLPMSKSPGMARSAYALSAQVHLLRPYARPSDCRGREVVPRRPKCRSRLMTYRAGERSGNSTTYRPSSVRSTVISRRPSGWSVSACRIGLVPFLLRRSDLQRHAQTDRQALQSDVAAPPPRQRQRWPSPRSRAFATRFRSYRPSRGAPTSRRNRLASRWAGRPARDQSGIW